MTKRKPKPVTPKRGPLDDRAPPDVVVGAAHDPFYQGFLGSWRWHIQSAQNGNILGDSGQGYSRKIDCEDGFLSMADIAAVEAAKIRAARKVKS